MGFIGYSDRDETGGERSVRVYLECQEESESGKAPSAVSFTYQMDFVFYGDKASCKVNGVEDVLALKKFYKLVFSLEERAREHGKDWRNVFSSAEDLLEHLRYTRNARDLKGNVVRRRVASGLDEDIECAENQ